MNEGSSAQEDLFEEDTVTSKEYMFFLSKF